MKQPAHRALKYLISDRRRYAVNHPGPYDSCHPIKKQSVQKYHCTHHKRQSESQLSGDAPVNNATRLLLSP
ncbi:hypothetical protein QUG62_26190, partial [Klebsiella michiganensis]|uniref:hypothetical protein n=1 Tax=Klebsiella michiganensis TaxID=1134687 RepID=UPI0025A10263